MSLPIGYLIKDELKNKTDVREPRIVMSTPQIHRTISVYEEHKVSDYLNQTHDDLEVIKQSVEESQVITPTTHCMVNAMFETIQQNLGYKSHIDYPSLESFSQVKSGENVKVIVLESISSALRKVWDYIKKLFKQLWDAVRGFFKRMYSQEARVEHRIKQLKKRFDELKFTVPKEQDTEGFVFTDAFATDGVLKRGDVQVIINNHILTIKDAKKGLNELLDTLNYNQKTHEALSKAIRDISENVKGGNDRLISGGIEDVLSRVSSEVSHQSSHIDTSEGLVNIFGFKEYNPPSDVKRDYDINDKCVVTRSEQLMGNRSIMVVTEKNDTNSIIRIDIRDIPYNSTYDQPNLDVRVEFLSLSEMSSIFNIVEGLFKVAFEHDHLRTLDRVEKSVERIIKLHDANDKVIDDVLQEIVMYYKKDNHEDREEIVMKVQNLKGKLKLSRDLLSDTYKVLTSYYRQLFQPSVAVCMVALNYIELSINNYEA